LEAPYDPDTLKVLFQAFDEVWTTLAPRYGDDQPAIEAARITLANIVLSLSKDDSRDVARLKGAALTIFNGARRKLDSDPRHSGCI
jgi:hypothetical protein